MYKNLVFKGGGVKTYTYIGVIEALEKSGFLVGIEKVVGSSAGGLYTVLVGLNFSASEIRSFMNKIDVGEEIRAADPDDTLKRFFKEYGQYSGDFSINAFREILSNKLGDADVTFRGLHDRYGHMKFKEIYLTGVDISEGKSVIFSYEDTPDMKLIDALRISCSYPLMYIPFKGSDGHYYVDGGLLNNYPVSVFFNDTPCEDKVCKSSKETLGLFLGNHEEESALGLNEISVLVRNITDKFGVVNGEKLQRYLTEIDYSGINEGMNKPITDIISYISHLFHAYSLVDYKDYDIDEILIEDNHLNALDLNITDQQIQCMIDNGKNTTEDFINTHYSSFS
ncbi:MAG: patatin-like phospholipase family protein [Rickettsiaceae bacterium H1]|nr:patatin-like phospholipase family protein [Rickettsiaceae bacterium H1]